MKDIILIVSNTDDTSVNSVISLLEKNKLNFYRLNSDKFPSNFTFDLYLDFDNNISGKFFDILNNVTIPLDKIKSIWYRRPSVFIPSEYMDSGYIQFIQDESAIALWSLWTSLKIPIINPPLISNKLLEHNKIFQLQKANQVGLRTPRTLISNDPNQLLNFCHKNQGQIAVKLLKSNFFIKKGSNVNLGIFTNIISKEDIINKKENIKLCPIFTQEYVPKKLELRVTIVGQNIFSCAIHSQSSSKSKIDWRRYDLEKVKHEPITLPENINNKLLSLMRELKLYFGAVDMILTPDNEYVFLEINPNGQWGWIEELTKMPISKSMVELLSNPPEIIV